MRKVTTLKDSLMFGFFIMSLYSCSNQRLHMKKPGDVAGPSGAGNAVEPLDPKSSLEASTTTPADATVSTDATQTSNKTIGEEIGQFADAVNTTEAALARAMERANAFSNVPDFVKALDAARKAGSIVRDLGKAPADNKEGVREKFRRVIFELSDEKEKVAGLVASACWDLAVQEPLGVNARAFGDAIHAVPQVGSKVLSRIFHEDPYFKS